MTSSRPYRNSRSSKPTKPSRNGWTDKQQRMAVIASTKAGWNGEQRYIVMHHCGCPLDPVTRLPSVKAERNTQQQFQAFMAFAEPVAAHRGKPLHPPGEHPSWFACVNDQASRMRHRIIDACAEAARVMPGMFDDELPRKLVGHCANTDTAGFLPAQPETLEQCDLPTLVRVFECLRAWVGREFAKIGHTPSTFNIPRSAMKRAEHEQSNQRETA